jgi:hypothetical protein
MTDSPTSDRDAIVLAMQNHFRSVIETGRGLPFAKTRS